MEAFVEFSALSTAKILCCLSATQLSMLSSRRWDTDELKISDRVRQLFVLFSKSEVLRRFCVFGITRLLSSVYPY